MTTSYTGVNAGSFLNLLSGPEAGEFVTAASIGLVAQAAANQTKFLFDTITRVAYTDQVRGFNGRVAVGPARVAVGDPGLNATLGLPGSGADYEGVRFDLAGQPATNRTVSLDNTGTTPVDGEILTVFIGAMGSGLVYRFKRSGGGGAIICDVYGLDKNDGGAWIEFEYRTGTGWKLGRNSGACYSAALAGVNSAGVVPGPGA